MARTGPIHGFGVLLLFAASICLLISSISAPVVNNISVFRVDVVKNGSTVSFGSFGYCILNVQSGGDLCTPRMIGYKPAEVMANINGNGFGSSSGSLDTADGLTNVMVLHAVACGVAFIAFLTSLGAGVVGSLIGFVIGLIAWIITLVVMATDFVSFAIIRNGVNQDGTGDMAYFSSAMWTVVAAFIMLFLGMFIVLFTCCSARRQRRRDREAGAAPKNDYGTPAGRRWYHFRR